MRFRDFNSLSATRQQAIASYFVRFGIERLSAKRRRRFHGRIQKLVWRALKQGETKIPASRIKSAVLGWEKQAQGQREHYAKRARLRASPSKPES
jgi:hypothetical protein